MIFHSKLEEALLHLQEELLSAHKQKALTKAFQTISDRYRKESGFFLQTEEERWAYFFTRLPATFAVISKVFKELSFLSPETFLDVGAGPGTGLWAALEQFPSFLKYTLLEQDLQFLSMGKKLASLESSLKEKADWRCVDVRKPFSSDLHDITLLSYSIGEIGQEHWKDLLTTLWNGTKQAIVLIEPGTPSGYRRMMKLRDLLKEMGGFIWAPCPHNNPCPLSKEDWCHFSVRVQRSSLHRLLKSAELGHEDEKFCYLIVGKNPREFCKERIIRHPMKHSGFVELTLCTELGIKKTTYSKRDQEKYRSIKKLSWGDSVS